jgi:hypothetical protein
MWPLKYCSKIYSCQVHDVNPTPVQMADIVVLYHVFMVSAESWEGCWVPMISLLRRCSWLRLRNWQIDFFLLGIVPQAFLTLRSTWDLGVLLILAGLGYVQFQTRLVFSIGSLFVLVYNFSSHQACQPWTGSLIPYTKGIYLRFVLQGLMLLERDMVSRLYAK